MFYFSILFSDEKVHQVNSFFGRKGFIVDCIFNISPSLSTYTYVILQSAYVDGILRRIEPSLRCKLRVPDKLGIGFIGAETQFAYDRFPREVVVLGTIGRPR